MRNLVLCLWLITTGMAPLHGSTQNDKSSTTTIPIHVTVDPRVELISIIFRLAGNHEYNQGRVPSYIHDVKEHFGPHVDHPAVRFASKLRKTRGISYDAPMNLAIRVTDVSELNERIPLDAPSAGLDQRWRTEGAREFLDKTRQFVKETDFEAFLAAHRSLFDTTVSRAIALLSREAHLEWFDSFFGARPGAEFRVILGMVNGPCCYGASIKIGEEEELYCILGVWKCNLIGIPRFDSSMLGTVAHEFCHAYVNPRVYARSAELEEAGKRIFSQHREKMKRMAYSNWQTMMHESVVRACVVRYLQATRGQEEARKEIRRQIEIGFLWTQELSDLLAQYEERRDRYPTLDSFFTRIVDFFEVYSLKLENEGR